jgi:hypothetical protein
MHKNAKKCKKTQSKWCINKHGASKIIDTFETYQLQHENKYKQKIMSNSALKGVCLFEAYRKPSKVVFSLSLME